MIGTLKDQRNMLKDLWVSRKGQLEQRFQFNLFKQDAEKVRSHHHRRLKNNSFHNVQYIYSLLGNSTVFPNLFTNV